MYRALMLSYMRPQTRERCTLCVCDAPIQGTLDEDVNYLNAALLCYKVALLSAEECSRRSSGGSSSALSVAEHSHTPNAAAVAAAEAGPTAAGLAGSGDSAERRASHAQASTSSSSAGGGPAQAAGGDSAAKPKRGRPAKLAAAAGAAGGGVVAAAAPAGGHPPAPSLHSPAGDALDDGTDAAAAAYALLSRLAGMARRNFAAFQAHQFNQVAVGLASCGYDEATFWTEFMQARPLCRQSLLSIHAAVVAVVWTALHSRG